VKRLFRDRWDKKIAGVCGGLGHYFKVDPTWIRLLFVILGLFTFVLPFLVLYILAWILVPLGPSIYIKIPCKKLYRSKSKRKFFGICGGLAEAFGMDPTVMRLIVVALCFITGVLPLIITYFLASWIIPENPHY